MGKEAKNLCDSEEDRTVRAIQIPERTLKIKLNLKPLEENKLFKGRYLKKDNW